MANTVTFLKNYKDFGFSIRLITAKSYLEKFQSSMDPKVQKSMMLRITEELIASTEDLTMWLSASMEREKQVKKYRDIWEFLLQCEADDEDMIKILKKVARIRTSGGLLKRLKLPPMKEIITFLKTDEDTVIKLVDKLLESIKASLHNRTASKRVLVRFHNKVKHGMMVQDYGNELFIRDLKTKINKKTNRITRKNRNLYLEVDLERAKKMVGSVEANAYAIKTLIILLLCDYAYDLKTSKKRLTKNRRKFLEEVLAA